MTPTAVPPGRAAFATSARPSTPFSLCALASLREAPSFETALRPRPRSAPDGAKLGLSYSRLPSPAFRPLSLQ